MGKQDDKGFGHLVVRLKDERILEAKMFTGDDYEAYLKAREMYDRLKEAFDKEERTDPNKCKGQVILQKVDIEEVRK